MSIYYKIYSSLLKVFVQIISIPVLSIFLQITSPLLIGNPMYILLNTFDISIHNFLSTILLLLTGTTLYLLDPLILTRLVKISFSFNVIPPYISSNSFILEAKTLEFLESSTISVGLLSISLANISIILLIQ